MTRGRAGPLPLGALLIDRIQHFCVGHGSTDGQRWQTVDTDPELLGRLRWAWLFIQGGHRLHYLSKLRAMTSRCTWFVPS